MSRNNRDKKYILMECARDLRDRFCRAVVDEGALLGELQSHMGTILRPGTPGAHGLALGIQ